MSNTTVTIKYSNGEHREFVASDELEKLINEGEMFSITTMHSDMSIDEEMSVSKMYVGNPVAAMGHMMMMRRNAQNIEEGGNEEEKKQMQIVIETLNACISLMSNEITSHQSGMSPVDKDWCEGCSPDNCSGGCKLGDTEVEGRMNCPIINSHCEYFGYQCDSNGEIAISHCSHPDNYSDTEGNCTSDLCPLIKESH